MDGIEQKVQLIKEGWGGYESVVCSHSVEGDGCRFIEGGTQQST